jgi:hypothetical protein
VEEDERQGHDPGREPEGRAERRSDEDAQSEEGEASEAARSLRFGFGVHVPMTSMNGLRLRMTRTVSVMVGKVSRNSRTPIIGYSRR